MTKKLELNPDMSYMLGLHQCNKQDSYVGVASASNELIERFVRLALYDLKIEPNKILVEEGKAIFYNSKIRKLFDSALGRRMKIFKYRNEYASNYLAALYDCNGGVDRKGLFLRNLEGADEMIMENIGFHSAKAGTKNYVFNQNEFLAFIRPYSIRANHSPAR